MEEDVPIQEETRASMSEGLHVSLPPRLSELRTLANMVEAFEYTHQIPETKIFIVNLALDELITNAVTCGFENVVGPRIDVRLSIDSDTLDLLIEDNGTPYLRSGESATWVCTS